MLHIVSMYLAKSISRQHLLRFHPRQHKGRLDLDRRTRTHALARVGGGTTSHWLGRWSGGNDRLPLWYFMESLRGGKYRQWHDGGESFLVQFSTRRLGPCCKSGLSEQTCPIAQSLSPEWQMLTPSSDEQHSMLPDTQFSGSFAGDLKDWFEALVRLGRFSDATYVNIGNAG